MSEGLRWKITKAVRHSDLPSSAKLLMLVLADVADVGTAEIPPQWSPSLTGLTQETGLARNTITKYLKHLEGLGWLKRAAPSPRARGYGQRTSYILCLPDGAQHGELPLGHTMDLGHPMPLGSSECESVGRPVTPSGSSSDPTLGPPVTPVGNSEGTTVPPLSTHRSVSDLAYKQDVRSFSDPQIRDLEPEDQLSTPTPATPLTPRSTGSSTAHQHTYLCDDRNYRCLDEDPDFRAFWNAYPWKTAIGEARPAYAMATRTGADPTKITAGALTYANDPTRKPQYTVKPAKWLFEERWADQPVQQPVRRRPVVEGW